MPDTTLRVHAPTTINVELRDTHIVSKYNPKFKVLQDLIEPRHEISNNVVCATSKASDQPAHTRSDQSLCLSLKYSMVAKLLSEHHLELLSVKGGCTGSSESTSVEMSHCWKSHVMA